MFRAILEPVILSILYISFTLASECFHSSVIEAPVNCTLERRPNCAADTPQKTGQWPNNSLVIEKQYHSDNRTYELTWNLSSGAGTDYLNRLEGIQIKIHTLTPGTLQSPDSCDRMLFNASEDQVNGAVKQRRLPNSRFHYTINCSDSRNVGRTKMILLSLLPLQLRDQQTPAKVRVTCPAAPTTPSPGPNMVRRTLNDFLTGDATENDFVFQGDGRLSISFYNKFRQYANVHEVTFYLMQNSNSAYNFYHDEIKICAINKLGTAANNITECNRIGVTSRKFDIEAEVSYPCDDLFKYLKADDNYQILVKVCDANGKIVVVKDGTKNRTINPRLPVTINADTYEHHVTAENITIEQFEDSFNVTFPIAPRHLDMPNRFDIQIPSLQGITRHNITRGEVESLNYHWRNYTYTEDLIKLSAGERITISLIVWNKNGSKLILEKNYTFPQTTTTSTTSTTSTGSSTPETDPELIIAILIPLGVLLIAAILMYIIIKNPERVKSAFCFFNAPKIVLWYSAVRDLNDMKELRDSLIESGAKNVILCNGEAGMKVRNCRWIIHCEEIQSLELKEFHKNHGKNAKTYRVKFGRNDNGPNELTADHYVLHQDLQRLLVALDVKSCDDAEQQQQRPEVLANPEALPQCSIRAQNLTSTSHPNSPRLNRGGYRASQPPVLSASPGAESSTSQTHLLLELRSSYPSENISLVGPNQPELDTARFIAEHSSECQTYTSDIDSGSVISFHTDVLDGINPPSTENSTQWSPGDARPPPSGRSEHRIPTQNVVVTPDKQGNNAGAGPSSSLSIGDQKQNQLDDETAHQFTLLQTSTYKNFTC